MPDIAPQTGPANQGHKNSDLKAPSRHVRLLRHWAVARAVESNAGSDERVSGTENLGSCIWVRTPGPKGKWAPLQTDSSRTSPQCGACLGYLSKAANKRRLRRRSGVLRLRRIEEINRREPNYFPLFLLLYRPDVNLTYALIALLVA